METQPVRRNARVLTASVVGTAVEYYDFYIYGYAAALVFGPLFFPAASPTAQTIFAFMTFGLAFLARPIGAITFGHYGDRLGRKATLVASLLIMGGCTFAIAFIPTWPMAEQLGAAWLAPTLLCLLRFGQGFGLGGEWTGAALLSIENAPPGWRARFGITPPLGATIGNITAIAVFLLMGLGMSEAEFTAWGWRVPFLVSVVLIVIGMWIRLNIGETQEFRDSRQHKTPPRVPIVELFARHSPAVLAGMVVVICPFMLVFLAGPFALAQAMGSLGHERDTFLLVQLLALVVAVPLLFFAARYTDQTSPARTLAVGGLAVVPVGILFGFGLDSGSLLLAGLAVLSANLAWVFVQGGLNLWLAQLYPVEVRYSGFAFAFNTGGIIGGAGAPIAAQMVSAEGGVRYVGLMIAIAGLATFLVAKASRPTPLHGPEQAGMAAIA